MKADKNFKMSKVTKRALALIDFPSKQSRNAFKKNMILAQIISEDVSRKPLNRKDISEEL
jgi:hypothetical protein